MKQSDSSNPNKDEHLAFLVKAKNILQSLAKELSIDINLFPKQIQFISASKCAIVSLLSGANRSGKSFLGAMISRTHSIGIYPSYWPGNKFDYPTTGIVVGQTKELIDSFLKPLLLGVEEEGIEGIIPFHCIKKAKGQKGLINLKENSVLIDWRNGSGISKILFRSQKQSWNSIRSYRINWIWIDEEVELIYLKQALRRILGADGKGTGRVYITATPEHGVTPFVTYFFRQDVEDIPENAEETFHKVPPETFYKKRFYMHTTWADNPYLSEDEKEFMRATLLPHELEAAEFGRPCLGIGAVFQMPEASFIKPPIQLLPHFALLNGFDVGINDSTAVVYAAYDIDNKHLYIYDVYKKNGLLPTQHVECFKKLNKDLKVRHLIDPSANNRSINESVKDMETVAKSYRALGMNIMLAKKPIKGTKNSIVQKIYEMVRAQKFTIFNNCIPLIDEIRGYRRGENLQIIEGGEDHAIDSLFFIINGLQFAQPPSEYNTPRKFSTGYF